MTEARIEVRGIDKSFTLPGRSLRTRRVLRGVDVTVQRGEVVALVGESGSGKTTVARIFCRLIDPDAGELWIDGRQPLLDEPRKASRAYRQRVQMIFQDPFGSLNPVHSVEYHIARPLQLHGRASGDGLRQAVLDLLSEVGLTPAQDYLDRHPHELSGGQRQRVAIARALATDPEYLMADEPTSMLDVATRRAVLDLLARLARERHLGVLFVTHDLQSARHLADRTLVMYAGRIVERGPTSVVLHHARHPYTSLLLSARPGPDSGFRDPPPDEASHYAIADTGCPYAERCPRVESACRSAMPKSLQIDDSHVVVCRNPIPATS